MWCIVKIIVAISFFLNCIQWYISFYRKLNEVNYFEIFSTKQKLLRRFYVRIIEPEKDGDLSRDIARWFFHSFLLFFIYFHICKWYNIQIRNNDDYNCFLFFYIIMFLLHYFLLKIRIYFIHIIYCEEMGWDRVCFGRLIFIVYLLVVAL